MLDEKFNISVMKLFIEYCLSFQLFTFYLGDLFRKSL